MEECQQMARTPVNYRGVSPLLSVGVIILAALTSAHLTIRFISVSPEHRVHPPVADFSAERDM